MMKYGWRTPMKTPGFTTIIDTETPEIDLEFEDTVPEEVKTYLLDNCGLGNAEAVIKMKNPSEYFQRAVSNVLRMLIDQRRLWWVDGDPDDDDDPGEWKTDIQV
jgi:hypothetical protein